MLSMTTYVYFGLPMEYSEIRRLLGDNTCKDHKIKTIPIGYGLYCLGYRIKKSHEYTKVEAMIELLKKYTTLFNREIKSLNIDLSVVHLRPNYKEDSVETVCNPSPFVFAAST